MNRFPSVPAVVSTEPIEAAMPKHTVETSQRMNCMAS